ncbi:GAF domain-containing protein [Reichenbachiella sp. MALMAid0571]|uniref:GAF domain-containing protein n=1 Tax=Reichenbachiella sp. MALMAid0571 TaxID=3143939 RepID=UPI0032DEA0FE
MSENLIISQSSDKVSRYESLIPQIEALIAGEPDLVANLANVSAALKQTFDFFWVGFYLVKNDELVLGPFQGPIACTRIQRGKGVCGTAWQRGETVIVEDVDEFPGHIACNFKSRSEIVVPAFKSGKVFLVLDIDNEQLNYFDKTDQVWLEKLTTLLCSGIR